jgi:hypothetical protein
VLWILVPLILFIIFGHYVRKKAERVRAEDAARTHVMVSIRLEGKGMAMREELRLRNAIEDEIGKRGLGTVDDAGSGGGTMHLRLATADAERAVAEIREILAGAGVLGRAEVRRNDSQPSVTP